MNTNTETPSPAAIPVAEPVTHPSKRARGGLNQSHLRRLNTAGNIGLAAQHADHTPALGSRDITADATEELMGDIGAARNKSAEALQHTTAALGATAAEAQAGKALHAALVEVQKAAKQKYARTNRIALGDYFVGGKLNGSRPNLLQTSQSILSKLGQDELPGFTAAKIKALSAKRQAWIDAKTAGVQSASAARTARAEFKAMLKSIDDRRVAIQLAADAEWPHGEEANAGTRRQFGLSPQRPFKA